ncbi:hypothetical protein APHAL10511_007809 [Amanita phalloides]|nr:hypothetical protein APHAL10511_007809 [Amanita phalloides]
MVSLTISSPSRPPSCAQGLPITIDVPKDATVIHVKNAVANRFPKFYPARQKISIKDEKKALDDDARLSDVLGEKFQAGELHVKDLGPQIDWRTVFLVEYLGPLVIHPLFYRFPQFWYGQTVEHSTLQKFAYWLVIMHFVKRELEAMFVHRFSHGTMPLMNIFKNSSHYHLFSGLLLAYDLYRPIYSAASLKGTIWDNDTFLMICGGLWAFAELSNLRTHLTLRSLRPEGSRQRAIPYGYGFSFLSCPNYFFEALAWIVFSVMTGSIAASVFTLVSVCQMAIWAGKKHMNYKKEFGKDYPSGRYAMIPFIL